jgi:tRNA(Ile)-lysidine synthase
MIKLLHPLPRDIFIAFSGGVDSLAAAHFLRNNHRVTLLHFHHGCEYSDEILHGCLYRAEALELNMVVENIEYSEPPKGVSLEDHWRRARYRFLRRYENVVTCHHLDDAIETWVWSSLHGEGKLIPSRDSNVIRPFLLTPKADLIAYASKHGLEPVNDPFNGELHLTRNYIRANIIPHALKINPGLPKVIRKKYLKEVE